MLLHFFSYHKRSEHSWRWAEGGGGRAGGFKGGGGASCPKWKSCLWQRLIQLLDDCEVDAWTPGGVCLCQPWSRSVFPSLHRGPSGWSCCDHITYECRVPSPLWQCGCDAAGRDTALDQQSATRQSCAQISPPPYFLSHPPTFGLKSPDPVGVGSVRTFQEVRPSTASQPQNCFRPFTV